MLAHHHCRVRPYTIHDKVDIVRDRYWLVSFSRSIVLAIQCVCRTLTHDSLYMQVRTTAWTILNQVPELKARKPHQRGPCPRHILMFHFNINIVVINNNISFNESDKQFWVLKAGFQFSCRQVKTCMSVNCTSKGVNESVFSAVIWSSPVLTKLRCFISHTFRYHSPSYHARQFLFYLTCKCLWISSD